MGWYFIDGYYKDWVDYTGGLYSLVSIEVGMEMVVVVRLKEE